MSTELKILNPDDYSTLLDLNALNTAWANPDPTGFGLLGDVNLGGIEATTEWLEASPSNLGFAGDLPVKTRHPNVEMSFKLWALGTSIDDLEGFVRSLNNLLNRQGVMLWKPDGAAEPRYIDYFASPLNSLLRGQDRAMQRIIDLLMEEGLPVTVVRHPYLRGPKFTALLDAVVGNGTGNRTAVLENTGNVPSITKVTITPEQAESKVVEVNLARRSQGNLSEFAAQHSFQIEDADSFYNSTAVLADAEASGGNVAETDFAAASGLYRRWRKTITPGDLTAFQGRFKVFYVLKVTDAGRYHVQMRWSEGDGDPCENLGSREGILLDFSDVEKFHLVEIDMGVIELKRGGTLTLEGWAARDPIDDDDTNSTGDLRWDQCFILPFDETNSTISVPGHRRGGSNPSRYLGRELKDRGGTNPPTDEGDTVVLNNVDEWAATPAQQLDTGRHKVTVRVSIRNKNKKRQLIGYLKVTAQGSTVAADDGSGPIRIPLRSRRKLWTKRRKSIQFDVGTGGLSTLSDWRFMVEMTNEPTDSEAKIVVQVLTHRYHRYSTPTAPMVLDGESRQARLYQGANPTTNLSIGGGFLYVAPGSNLLAFSLGDAPQDGYGDVDDRESLSKVVPGRTAKVTVEVIPRYTA